MNNHTAIEWAIEKLEDKRKSIQYDFVNAKTFGERRQLFTEYLEVDKEINNLINFS